MMEVTVVVEVMVVTEEYIVVGGSGVSCDDRVCWQQKLTIMVYSSGAKSLAVATMDIIMMEKVSVVVSYSSSQLQWWF